MKKTKINFIIMLAIVLASVFTNSAFAQKSHCEKGGMHGMCKGDKNMGFLSDLTPEQQKQIDALKLNLIKETISLKNQIAEKKAHINTISYGDNVDMAAVNKAFDELFALKAEIAKKHAAFQQEVRKLLTPEQKIQFDIHKSKVMKGGKGSCEGEGQKCRKSETGSENGCSHDGMGSGNCKEKMGGGCCKEKAAGEGCNKATDGSGEDHSKGCQGHGQMDGTGKNCPKK